MSNPQKLLSLSGRADNAAKAPSQNENADFTKTTQAHNFMGGIFKRRENNR